VTGKADKLTWYWRRMQSMSPSEVGHRALEASRQVIYKRVPPSGPRRRLDWSGVASSLGDLVIGWAADPAVEPYRRDRTAEWLAGDVELMGYHWPTAEEQPAWHYEPCSGRLLPVAYCFDVDYRHGASAGEVRLVWELNRCLWLLPPAAQAVITADAGLAAACDRVVDGWLDANPPFRGVNWSSGIEVAHQAVALIVLEELIGRILPDPGRRQARMQRVAVMVDWIRRFPSLYSSANNHRICELGGTFIAGCAVEGVCGVGELDQVMAELETRALQQHAPDGFNAEQAPHYGAFTLEWLALSARVAASAGRPASQVLSELMKGSASSLAALTDSGGHLLRFGDDDDASVLSFVLPSRRRVGAVLDLAGLEPDELTAIREPGLRKLGASWYTVARSSDPLGETFLVFDHAPLGFGSIAAHGHADALGVWVSVAGQPLLIEAGTYLYHAQPEWRQRLRATRAHNTLAVEGLDSSVPSGPFNWRRDLRANCEIVRLRSDRLYLIEAQHDGFESRLGTRHVRRVERVEEGIFRVEDCLTGAALHQVEATFVVAPEVEVGRRGSVWVLTRGDGTEFRLGVSSGFELSEIKGSLSPLEGWCSTSFGHLEPTWVLHARGTLGGGGRLIFDLDLTGRSLGSSTS
jgi:hypothetical protein